MIMNMDDEYFETHGDELFGNVFRCTFYNHERIFGEALLPDQQTTPESSLNNSIH